MESSTQNPDAAELLAHAQWLRALARKLVADQHAADDLVQQTWLKALQKGPRETGRLRNWLRAVTRNQARQNYRDEQRRRLRETGSRKEAGASSEPAEVVEQVEMQRVLMDIVSTLPAAYRDVLFLHFYQGLSLRQIAQRQENPYKTVHTRLQRALAAVRSRLDQHYGGSRETWLHSMTLWMGSAPMLGWGSKAAAGGLLLIASSSGYMWLQAETPVPNRMHVAPVQAPLVAALNNQEPERADFTRDEEQVAVFRYQFKDHATGHPLAEISTFWSGVSTNTEEIERITDANGRVEFQSGIRRLYVRVAASRSYQERRRERAPSGRHSVSLRRRGGSIQGRVRAMNEESLAGAKVQGWYENEKSLVIGKHPPFFEVKCNANGEFAVENVGPGKKGKGDLILFAFADRTAMVQPLQLKMHAGAHYEDLILICEAAKSLSGEIRAADNQLVAGATVEIKGARPQRKPGKLRYGSYLKSFTFAAISDSHGQFRFPSLPAGATRLKVFHDEFPYYEQHLIGHEQHLLIGLPQSRQVYGVVLDEKGEPLPGARISLHSPERRPSQVTDKDGGFFFKGIRAKRGGYLRILAPRHALHIQRSLHSKKPGGPLEIRLRPEHRVRGQLLDIQGQPVTESRLFLWGKTLLPQSQGVWNPLPVACFIPSALHAQVDDEGRFEFRNLFHDEYELWFMDKEMSGTLAMRTFSVAETELEVRLGDGWDQLASLEGWLMNPDGRLLSDEVTVTGTFLHRPYTANPVTIPLRFQVRTESGHFQIRGLKPGYWRLTFGTSEFRAPDFMPQKLHAGWQNLQIRLEPLRQSR